MSVMKPIVGHILRGSPEKPLKLFRVQWFSPGRVVGMIDDEPIVWTPCFRHTFCQVETEQGALELAMKHHPEGQNFVAQQVDRWE